MSLVVHTARISTCAPDRFDITRKSGGERGIVFAPSWAILRPALDRLRTARYHQAMAGAEHENERDAEASRARHSAEAERVATMAWITYVPAYMAEMRLSYRGEQPKVWEPVEAEAWANGVRPNRPAWEALLARSRVVLACYCVDPTRCHRTLLAGILGKLGADVREELQR